MASDETLNAGRFKFTIGRMSAEDARDELSKASKIAPQQLLAQMPVLSRGELAFGLFWASDAYGDSLVGQLNAAAVGDWVILQVPEMNVAGDARPGLYSPVRSYAIDTVSQRIVSGGADFFGAQDFLDQHYAYAGQNTG